MLKNQSSKTTRLFHEELLPFCLPIAYPFPSIWLSTASSLQDLPANTSVIVRDGLTPLLWFLHKAKPQVTMAAGKFLVHQEVWRGLPRDWQRIFGTFRLVSLIKKPIHPTRLLLFGCPDPGYVSLAQVEEKTQDLRAICEKNKIREKLVFLPQHSWSTKDFLENYEFDFYKILFRNLGTDIKILGRQDVWTASLYNRCLVADLNRGQLVGANAFLDYTLSQGARLAQSRGLESNEKLHACSSLHAIALTENPSTGVSRHRVMKPRSILGPKSKGQAKNKTKVHKMSGLYNEDLLCKAIKLSQKEWTTPKHTASPFLWPPSFASCVSDWLDRR